MQPSILHRHNKKYWLNPISWCMPASFLSTRISIRMSLTLVLSLSLDLLSIDLFLVAPLDSHSLSPCPPLLSGGSNRSRRILSVNWTISPGGGVVGVAAVFME